MLREQQGQCDQFCVAEREPKQRIKFSCPSCTCTLAALLEASSVHVSVQDETTISSPSGFSTGKSKLGSGKINCLGLPHARVEETAALCLLFLRISLSATGHVHKKRELVISRLFSLACFCGTLYMSVLPDKGRLRGQHAELKKLIWER